MENKFRCPFCKGHLRVGEYIIFRVRNQKDQYGLLLLHPQIGNYDCVKHPDYHVVDGDALEFFCPMCNHTLKSDLEDNLVYLMMEEPDGQDFDVYFSRIVGEQSTFKVQGETVTATGEHFGKYTYFRMSNRYKNFLKM